MQATNRLSYGTTNSVEIIDMFYCNGGSGGGTLSIRKLGREVGES
jgi:hypothetical protein